jgi:3-hydroxyethyl bacteriochlorophyllide a dehydrogenase
MDTVAVVMQGPGSLALSRLTLDPPGSGDVTVETLASGISTGTEKLLWTGRMPAFAGMGYPLVPGYETVGRVVDPGTDPDLAPGTLVFVPGARCFGAVRGLFGGAASRLVVPRARLTVVDERLGADAVLLALAATAHHALAGGPLPDLVVGHGVLGRLIARIAVALGGNPVVHETNPARRGGAVGYTVLDPADDPRLDRAVICDASGAPDLLDDLVARLAPGGEIVLAGFYEARLHFAFPPAFMREARIRIAAQWQPADLEAVLAMVRDDRLSFDGLITHRAAAANAPEAYGTAFGDPACLKMILDWSGTS